MYNDKRIIISRTDSIGDVILTLPMLGIIKSFYPDCKILFLGRTYTKAVIELCANVDEFHDFSYIESLSKEAQIEYFKKLHADIIIHVFPKSNICKIAKLAEIPIRIGTSHRFYNWLYCNKLNHFSRKKSNKHEAELNLTLLKDLGIQSINLLSGENSFQKLANFYNYKNLQEPPIEFKSLLDDKKFNLIIHPKSKGSAREWSLESYSELINMLPKDKFKIFISGAENEKEALKDFLSMHSDSVIDLVGKMTLTEFISFINASNGLIAASTGPLHIAASLGKNALGLYPSQRPINPQRWAPIGKKAEYIKEDGDYDDIYLNISPKQVFEKINTWLNIN